VFEITETASFPSVAVEANTTTLAFPTVLEVPFTQTYGGWIIVAVIIVVLVILAIWMALKRRPKPRSRRIRR
jgi:hypothetical protein